MDGMLFKGIIRKSDGSVFIGFTCLRIEISGGILWAWF
jgi:hypothetical protein